MFYTTAFEVTDIWSVHIFWAHV